MISSSSAQKNWTFFCFTPYPETVISSCSAQCAHPVIISGKGRWVGIQTATGRRTLYTPHGSDKQRKTPSDFLVCCSLLQYIVVDVHIVYCLCTCVFNSFQVIVVIALRLFLSTHSTTVLPSFCHDHRRTK